MRWIMRLGWLGLGWCLAGVATTFIPGAPRAGILLALIPAVVLTLPAGAASGGVLTELVRSGRIPWQSQMTSLLRLASLRVRLLTLAGWIMFVAVAVHAVVALPDGNVQERAGRYILNNHGTISETTKAVYLEAMSLTERLCYAVPGSLVVGSLFILYMALRLQPDVRSAPSTT